MRKIISLYFFTSISLVSFAQNITYKVSMTNPHTHYFEVEMIIENYEKPTIDVKMPVWAPGSYLVREFSKNVEDFHAFAGDKEITYELINKNTWRIKSEKSKNIRIKYKVYANELSVRTSFVNTDHAYINGTSVFMFVEELKSKSINLKIEPFAGWGKTTTSLKLTDKNNFSVDNYDILVDSPIEIGNHVTFEFNAAGVKHTVAMFGEGNFNIDSLKKDMAVIVQKCTDIIGENPNKEYTFIIHNLSKSSGGLEHLSSTTLQVERWSYDPLKKYQGFLSLVAHEYFHLWNVKRIRPENLGPFDYSHECYSDLLWVSEGFTSYYDELILKRAGYYNANKFLEVLSGTISNVENQPGNKVQPVSEASFNAWIKAYRPNENSYNTTISYYPKGAIIGAMLDLEIINATKGNKNLDNVMQALYQKYYKQLNKGFTENDIKKEIENIVGFSMDAFFADYINDTKTIDYNKYFEYVGCQLINDSTLTKDKILLGIKTEEIKGQLMIKTVIRDTPAYNFGLNADDEIIAVNDFRITPSNFITTLNQFKSGESISILVSRDGILKNISVTLFGDDTWHYKLNKLDGLTTQQEINYKKWLNEN